MASDARSEQVRKDRITGMYKNALDLLADAELLAKNLEQRSVAASLVEIQAIEVLLKCAFYISTDDYSKLRTLGHDFKKIWDELGPIARSTILETANTRLPGHADLSNTSQVLDDWKTVFMKGRYYYEEYKNHTLEEQQKIGNDWIARGAPLSEAILRFHPHERTSLTYGLKCFIESHLGVEAPQS